MSATVELWGGPKDGREMTVEGLDGTLYFPVPPEISWVAEEANDFNVVDFRAAVYTARTGLDRYNSRGQVVFEWRGIR